MIQPTVGRALWFFYSRTAMHEGNQPLAATIVHVWSERCVNVAIFDRNGRPLSDPPTSVRLLQDFEQAPEEGCFCIWPSVPKKAA